MSAQENLSLMGVFAHPDDESWCVGGIMAKYAAQGVLTSLLCATRGEAGEISDPSLATRGNLGLVREQELRRACEVIGVRELRFLDVRDGEAGEWSEEEVRGKIVRAIRELRPQVVVTFGPRGATGHLDHITTSRLATEAFYVAGAPKAYAHQIQEGLRPCRPGKLYYQTGLPRGLADPIMARLKSAGVPARELEELEGFVEEDTSVTTIVDIAEFADLKLRALACHRTQMPREGIFQDWPQGLVRELMGMECFFLASPAVLTGSTMEEDVFAGIG